MKPKENILGGIKRVSKKHTNFLIEYKTGESAILWIVNDHVLRYQMSPNGIFLEYPKPNDPSHVAKITVIKTSDYDLKTFKMAKLEDDSVKYTIVTRSLVINFDKVQGTMSIKDLRSNKEILSEAAPLSYDDSETIQTLEQSDDEYYFGGGMQNGRFTHKGESIEILNTNNWVDGGVTSPCPFYWSTFGYGVLRNTWTPGEYDFGKSSDNIMTSHREKSLDAFYLINSVPRDILCDYYELTGKPIMMPMYSFYEAHLNAFNRDYWVPVAKDTRDAILFEDGKYYKCFQPKDLDGQDGILESLNGEKDNYQFSARAMIDRYKKHDIPLGWFVPNDGYGSGYGQTDSLDGDIQNLKEFGDYARKNGVELSVWTESNLHPVDPEKPKKGDRDLSKELTSAGVVALKCDVAWIGSGYSFGFSAVADAADIFVRETKNNIRTMIITVDGWAGTQRYAGIWSGDQRGGEWEYIRFHIPTYIGSGLSGQPNIGSDMDGIYTGGDRKVNIRDFQWKTFTPIQLVMDGWGWVPKAPFSFDDEVTKLNRAYLKLKSMFMPYNYNLGYEAVKGLPMIRAMFLEFPNENNAYTKTSQYQYMWGPNILVAPIYNDDEDSDGNSVRNGIYLPDNNQVWIDFHTGEKYQGGRILYNVSVPLWKIPVFIKDGAILPMCNPNNNPSEIKRDLRIFNMYPNGKSHFEVYEDDGISNYYSTGEFATTGVTTLANDEDLFITINKTDGTYKGIVRERSTQINIMTSKEPTKIKVAVGGINCSLQKANTKQEFDQNENTYYYERNFIVNPYLEQLVTEEHYQRFFLVKIGKIDVTEFDTQIKITGFVNDNDIFGRNLTKSSDLKPPTNINITEVTSTSVTLQWTEIKNASFYEIEKDGSLLTQMNETLINLDGFAFNSTHKFRVRSGTCNVVSNWSDFIEVKMKDDPYKDVINDIEVICNVSSEEDQELWHLVDRNFGSMWHTSWDNQERLDLLLLHFNLKNLYDISKIEYFPRHDAGNGTILEFQWRISPDKKEWTDFSKPVTWKEDSSVKTLELVGKRFQFFEMKISKTVGNYGSGRAMLFYKCAV